LQDSIFAGVVDTADKFIGGVVDTGEQFFGGVVDTGDKFSAFWLFLTGINNKNLSPVSFTPAINNNSRISPRIFEKIQNCPNGILMGMEDTDS
jgi:hypothetical protein